MGFVVDNGVLVKYEEEPEVTEVIVTSSVTRIGKQAFAFCNGLTEVTIRYGVNYMDYEAFRSCHNLRSISIPASIREIPGAAFIWCDNLTEVSLPDSVIAIRNGAFRLCKSLAVIRLPSHLKVLDENAFAGCGNLERMDIPRSVRKIGNAACYAVNEINVSKLNRNYASMNGVLYDKWFTRLIQCPIGKQKLTIPESVSVIEREAFLDCEKLTSLTLPPYLKQIKTWAFSYCKKLEEITIPATVSEIESNPFMRCDALREIHVSPKNRYYTAENGILYNKQCTEIVHFPLCEERVELADTVRKFPMRLSSGECKTVVYKGFEFTCSTNVMRYLLDAVVNKEFQYFSSLPEPVQCDVLWKLYCMEPDRWRVKMQIQDQLHMLFCWLIDRNDAEAAEQMLTSGRFDFKDEIEGLILYANEKQQFDFQIMLMNYSKEHIKLDTNRFEL